MGEAIEIGDVVQLKSGGPKMTVTGKGLGMMTGPDDFNVTWFDVKGELKHGSFGQKALEKVPA